MNKQLQLLLKNRFFSQLKWNLFLDRSNQKRRKMQYILLIIFIWLAIMGIVYCLSLAYGLYVLGLGEAVPAISFTITSIITVVLTLLKANGEFFQFKEYETLSVLPIRTSMIVASRFFYLYIWNLVCSMLIMLPMGSVYIFYERPHLLFDFLWFLSVFLTPLLTTTIVAMISSFIMYLAAKSRNASLISSGLTSLLFLTFASVSFIHKNTYSVDRLLDLKNNSASRLQKLYKINPSAQLYNIIIVKENIGLFILCTGIILVSCWLLIKGLSFKYQSINAHLMSPRRKNNYRLTMTEQKSQIKALYVKELKRLFASSVYLTNTTIGLILSLITSVFFSFSGEEVTHTMNDLPQLMTNLPHVAPFILSLMVALSCTSCVSLSLEGHTIWCLQSLPIPQKNIYKSKILVNLTFTLPTILICASLLACRLQLTIFERTVLFLIPIMYAFFSAVWGIFINYKFLNYHWESETQVVKQSVASMLGMLGGMFFVVISMIPLFFVTGLFYKIYCVSLIVVIGTVTSILYVNQIKKRL